MPSVDVDVIVIGAGISGLVAANTLVHYDKSLSVTILEASDRVGGRIKREGITLKENGESSHFDVGGQWVSSGQKEIMEVLDELSLQTIPQSSSGRKIIEIGARRRSYKHDMHLMGRNWLALLELQFLMNKIDKLSEQVDMRHPYSSPRAKEFDSETLHTFLKRNTRFQGVYEIFEAAVRSIFGTDTNSFSLLYFLAAVNTCGSKINNLVSTDKGSAQELVIRGGAGQIAEKLALDTPPHSLLLNHPVQSVVQEHGNVYVTTKNGQTFIGKRVVCAIPPNMVNQIEFHPQLPSAKRHMISSMFMPPLVKFIVIYNKAHWSDNGYSGEVISSGGPVFEMDVEGGPITAIVDAGTGMPALAGFLGGSLAVQWMQKGEEEFKEAVLERLSRYFKASWPREAVYFIVKDWSSEVFIGGGPNAVPRPGTMHAFYSLRQPFDKVHFGGTETAVRWNGYMNGAVEAGKRCALEILDDLRPQSLSSHDHKFLEETRTTKGAIFIKPNDKKTGAFHIYRWTFFLPITCLAAGYLAYAMRDKYAHLLVPYH